jgi:hypothetical protein
VCSTRIRLHHLLQHWPYKVCGWALYTCGNGPPYACGVYQCHKYTLFPVDVHAMPACAFSFACLSCSLAVSHLFVQAHTAWQAGTRDMMLC